MAKIVELNKRDGGLSYGFFRSSEAREIRFDGHAHNKRGPALIEDLLDTEADPDDENSVAGASIRLREPHPDDANLLVASIRVLEYVSPTQTKLLVHYSTARVGFSGPGNPARQGTEHTRERDSIDVPVFFVEQANQQVPGGPSIQVPIYVERRRRFPRVTVYRTEWLQVNPDVQLGSGGPTVEQLPQFTSLLTGSLFRAPSVPGIPYIFEGATIRPSSATLYTVVYYFRTTAPLPERFADDEGIVTIPPVGPLGEIFQKPSESGGVPAYRVLAAEELHPTAASTLPLSQMLEYTP